MDRDWLLGPEPFANTGSWRQAKAGTGPFSTLALARACGDLLAVAARDSRIIGAEGRSYVNFASNDYLGLRFNQALIARAVEWAETYGVGSGASRLVAGNLDLFAPIEAKLATLKGKPAALVMASGFQTNAAVLQALFDQTVLGAEPLVFADRLNHASMHFGCQAAGVRQLRYRHCDAAHLAELLKSISRR